MRHINPDKDKKLKEERGASFSDIMEQGQLLDIRKNQNYSDQDLLIYSYQDYVWVVVVGENPERFITLYRSRKLKKEFGI